VIKVSFYHLTKTMLDEALPKLLEKVLETDSKALVLSEEKAEQEKLSKIFWSVGGTRLIPNAIVGDGESDGNEELQPVLISSDINNQNNANFLVLTGQSAEDNFSDFQRVLYIFNGNDNEELEFARNKWRSLTANDNLDLKYYFQDQKGNWQEK